MKHLFILSFIITYLCFGLELGYTATSYWTTHITYSFQHSGIVHLLINCIAFYSIFNLLEKCISPVIITLALLTIAFSVSFLCIYSRVVVGASSMLYAMVGIYCFLLVIRKIQINNSTRLYTSLAFIFLSLAVGFLKSNTAGMLHLLSYIAGFVFCAIYYLFTKSISIKCHLS